MHYLLSNPTSRESACEVLKFKTAERARERKRERERERERVLCFHVAITVAQCRNILLWTAYGDSWLLISPPNSKLFLHRRLLMWGVCYFFFKTSFFIITFTVYLQHLIKQIRIVSIRWKSNDHVNYLLHHYFNVI